MPNQHLGVVFAVVLLVLVSTVSGEKSTAVSFAYLGGISQMYMLNAYFRSIFRMDFRLILWMHISDAHFKSLLALFSRLPIFWEPIP
jgi:hypothetical protein